MKKVILGMGLCLSLAASPMFSTGVEASEHKVQKGDTLYKIATQNKLTTVELKKINNLTTDSLKLGQILKTSYDTVPTVKNSMSSASTTTKLHTVVSGDTLSKISTKYNISLNELLTLNNLKATSVIKIGQKLTVSKQTVTTIDKASVKITTTNKTTNNTNVSIATNNKTTNANVQKTYKVVGGDTISKIAIKNNISQSKLLELNNLTKTSIIKIGQVLILEEGNGLEVNTKISEVIDELKNYMNIPYVWGGTNLNGFDCSGLLYYTLKNHGITVPRTSFEMSQYGKAKEVSLDALQPGDFIYFETSDVKGLVTHVGIYIGNNEMIHASLSKGVGIDTLEGNDYWYSKLIKVNRIF